MKKLYLIAFTVLATLALGSCVQEIQDDNTSNVALADNGIAFVMKGGAATRAGDGFEVVSRGVTIPLGVTEDGTYLCLEETVTNLDAVAPVTRGTPAYTENLGVLYANQLGVHASANGFGDYAFENDGEITSNGWRYYHVYDSDPWPDEETPVRFYLRMPATINGLTTTNGNTTSTTAPTYGETGTITISYTSPATAADMQDILFGYTAMSKLEYKSKQAEGGAKVTLYHALTGVKFKIGNDDNDIDNNSIAIKEISFVGLKDKGTCTFTPPTSENDHSDKVAKWTDLGVTAADAIYSSGEYDEELVNFEEGGSFGEKGSYPNSFVADGNKNINKTDASQTFWLIPQEMTDDIRLKITYTFAGKESTGYLDFGKELKKSSIVWKPGELRTYTIRVQDVNLKITDQVHPGTTDNNKPVINSYKDDIVITNTGNTEVFIRAAIVGQWLDEDNNPVFGFTDQINNLYLVESWYEDQFVNHNGTHGEFVDLPGYENHNTGNSYGVTVNNWKYNSTDGYYYYTKVVLPGKATGEAGVDAVTGKLIHDPLFTSYTIFKIPKAEIGGVELPDVKMHFTLEIATQAIAARKSDGTVLQDSQWEAAWAAAKQGKKVE